MGNQKVVTEYGKRIVFIIKTRNSEPTNAENLKIFTLMEKAFISDAYSLFECFHCMNLFDGFFQIQINFDNAQNVRKFLQAFYELLKVNDEPLFGDLEVEEIYMITCNIADDLYKRYIVDGEVNSKRDILQKISEIIRNNIKKNYGIDESKFKEKHTMKDGDKIVQVIDKKDADQTWEFNTVTKYKNELSIKYGEDVDWGNQRGLLQKDDEKNFDYVVKVNLDNSNNNYEMESWFEKNIPTIYNYYKNKGLSELYVLKERTCYKYLIIEKWENKKDFINKQEDLYKSLENTLYEINSDELSKIFGIKITNTNTNSNSNSKSNENLGELSKISREFYKILSNDNSEELKKKVSIYSNIGYQSKIMGLSEAVFISDNNIDLVIKSKETNTINKYKTGMNFKKDNNFDPNIKPEISEEYKVFAKGNIKYNVKESISDNANTLFALTQDLINSKSKILLWDFFILFAKEQKIQEIKRRNDLIDKIRQYTRKALNDNIVRFFGLDFNNIFNSTNIDLYKEQNNEQLNLELKEIQDKILLKEAKIENEYVNTQKILDQENLVSLIDIENINKRLNNNVDEVVDGFFSLGKDKKQLYLSLASRPTSGGE